jgi:thymidylate synthase (FAD)
MKIITKPSVYVIGRQELDSDGLNRFLADHGIQWESDSDVPAEVITETAGRVCYMSFGKPRPGGNGAYLGHIKEARHGSVTEHAVWNLLITGISRSLSHEFVRHRAGFGYSQLSQRYVDESVAEYIEPAIIANDPELHAIWLESVEHSHAAYVKLASKLYFKFDGSGMDYTSRRKEARQAARSVLPNATETKLFITGNARALRYVLEQRGDRSADREIRQLANALLEILQTEAPNLFGDYDRTPLPDGTFEIKTTHRKV